MSVLSLLCLVINFDIKHEHFSHYRALLSIMVFLSSCRIFLFLYTRRHPLLIINEWGVSEYRTVDTVAGNFAYFLDRNLNVLSFIIVSLFISSMNNGNDKNFWGRDKAPFAYYLAMIWIIAYFCFLFLPVFCIFVFLLCLPLTALTFLRSYNSFMPQSQSFADEHANAATPEVLEKLWHCHYVPDESFIYKNPNNPDLHFQIARNDAECCICLEAYELGDELRLLSCKHHFHQPCADEWFKIIATCPLCVQSIDPDSAKNQRNLDVSSNV